jgi:hypothetical protein
MKRLLIFGFSLLVVLGVAHSNAIAQDQQESENSLLPEIDPQDIEIRSQFKARFPGLRRQPILGFDPTPRVYQIDPNRMPFMETPEQVVASVPVSELSRPDPPAYTPFDYSPDINAFARVGVGSYISPEAKFWGVSRLNPKSYIGGDFDYSSSDGHLSTQQSSFRFFDANAEYATKFNDQTRLGVNAGFKNSFNHMFDLAPGTPVPDSARKAYTGLSLGVDFEHFKNTVTGWKAQANVRYFDAELNNAAILSGTSEERVYNGSLAKRWAGSNVSQTFTIQAGIKGGNYTTTAISDDWLTAQGGIVYERLFNYSTKVKVDASVYYISNGLESKIYPGPSLTVKYPLTHQITLSLDAEAKPYVKTLEQLHTTNRFLNAGNALQHTFTINGTAEASWEYANTGQLNLGVHYANISDYPVFARNTTASSPATVYNSFYGINYADVYRLRMYGSVTHRLASDWLRVNAKVYAQAPNIVGGSRIPYEEQFGVNAGVTVQPFDRLTFETWADYVGSRKTASANTTLDAFLLLGGQLDLRITDRIGVYAKTVNALNQNYQVWQEYTERPFQVYGGVTVKL